jgi:predicted RNA-binding Zn ribbon-like protein
METNDTPQSTKRTPAPGELGLVQAFVNTVDLEEGQDQFRDAASMRDWLVDNGLIGAGAPVDDADLRLAVHVREALRSLAAVNNGETEDEQAVETLNRAAENTRLAVRFENGSRASLTPKLPGVDGALAKILGIVYTAMVDGTWSRFKACRSDKCRWVYFDRSKNRSSTWCSMKVCGNREKARTYRTRHR